MAEGARFGRLRSLRRRVAHAVAESRDIGQLRAELAAQGAELAAVRAAYARDAALFVAHRAAWDRERARLVAGFPSRVPLDNLINMDERRAR